MRKSLYSSDDPEYLEKVRESSQNLAVTPVAESVTEEQVQEELRIGLERLRGLK